MNSFRISLLSTAAAVPMALGLMTGGASALGTAFDQQINASSLPTSNPGASENSGRVNPDAAVRVAASCTPCAAKKVCNPCNACAAKKTCAAACNPCAAKKVCAACNPCAAKKVCSPCNPCAAKKD